MKIEIEFEEVQALKKTISILNERNRELEEKLELFNEKKIIYNARELSKKLLREYLKLIFKELGFDDNNNLYPPVSFGSIESKLGIEWYRSEMVNVVIGAEITNQWRRAFICFGILPEKK